MCTSILSSRSSRGYFLFLIFWVRSSWSVYRELIQTLNLCEGSVVVTEFLVIFPTFSEPKPRLKSFFAFLCQWQIFLLHCALRVCALWKNLNSHIELLMCQGFIFFPVLLWKHKSLSFWDGKKLQDCCIIKHVLLFTSLFIFASLDFSYFHDTLGIHLRVFTYFYFVCMHVLVFLGSFTKYYLVAWNWWLTMTEIYCSESWSLGSPRLGPQHGPLLVRAPSWFIAGAFLLCPHVVEQPRVWFVALSSWLSTPQMPHMLILSLLSVRNSTYEFWGTQTFRL